MSAHTYQIPASTKHTRQWRPKSGSKRHSYGTSKYTDWVKTHFEDKHSPYTNPKHIHSEYSNLASMDASQKKRRKKESAHSSRSNTRKKHIHSYSVSNKCYGVGSVQAAKNQRWVLLNLKSSASGNYNHQPQIATTFSARSKTKKATKWMQKWGPTK